MRKPRANAATPRHMAPNGDVLAAYYDARGRAQGASTTRLRYQARSLGRRHDQLDSLDLARAKAIGEELRSRGHIPS